MLIKKLKRGLEKWKRNSGVEHFAASKRAAVEIQVRVKAGLLFFHHPCHPYTPCILASPPSFSPLFPSLLPSPLLSPSSLIH
jgi:hypothetical protein